ncbi:hypothetical protein FA13DRAFT_1747942 [Coprinellus micaceus]|uniref:Cytochrome P450 n=1 Tax=Coprinellus micaceus TaxID=71717 RepID=A0A4Y7S0D0_COPMI|nr:hypothetical protein FA13DRAFT_1747942 [Coprinellus micaceus]
MPLENLEGLPYLTAVIKEGLRLPMRLTPLPRVAHENTNIAGVQVPAGTIVSMGQTFVHLNPDLFESPLSSLRGG